MEPLDVVALPDTSANGVDRSMFTLSGRYLFDWQRPAVIDPASPCFGRSQDLFAISHLGNLTAVLRARRSAVVSGVLLEGTATDRNFSRWSLDWASVAAPAQWHAIAPPSDQPIVDGRFTNWSPPGPGDFFVRLTVEDLAGNRVTKVRRVTSTETPQLTDLHVEPTLFSPNGDGVLDEAVLHYTVVGPGHFEALVFDASGAVVRRFAIDQGVAQAGLELHWDGRNAAGLPVPDGRYRVTLAGFEVFVEVDSTPPAVTADLHSI